MSDHNLEAERAAPELAPCPFCGGAAEYEEDWDANYSNQVACTQCPATVQVTRGNVSRWNQRRAPAVDEDGLPPPKYPQMKVLIHGTTSEQCGYTAEQVRQAQRDAVADDRVARRPRVTLDPALKGALDEAAKTRSTVALLPDGEPVFINYGDQPEDTDHLNCTACGGSGHIDDQRLIAGLGEPVAYLAQARKPGAWREFATLRGYSLDVDETLIRETPVYAAPPLSCEQQTKMLNQCDGCRQGAPVTPLGNHIDSKGKPFMYCQKQRYGSDGELQAEKGESA